MKIPVFHDDQHGTAIIVTACVRNWLEYSGRKAKDIKLVASGAGASAIACLNLLQSLGLQKKNIIVTDRVGVVYQGRNEGMDPEKEKYAIDTKMRTLDEAIKGADIFLGLSGPGVLTKEMVKKMGKAPLVLALANPTPEIMPEDVHEAKPDAIVCTGRSDYPNQVNNVLGFPFIFRGALDVGATTINEEMKLACVEAIASLARKEATAEVAAVYSNENLQFGPEYLIPKPFDSRLIVDLPVAIAKAAMASGVATRPIKDFEAYQDKLQQFFIRSQLVMRPIFTRAKENPKRIVYCEGEEDRVLQAVQMALDEGMSKPILIGREKVVASRIQRLGLRMKSGVDYELVDPEDDRRYRDYWTTYHSIMERQGFTETDAQTIVRTNTTIIGALMVHKNQADALICGTIGHYLDHMNNLIDIIGLKPGVETPAALTGLLLPKGTIFFCDTHVNPDPSVAQVSEMTVLAARELERFGIKPNIGLLSHSNFGTSDCASAVKMREVYKEVRRRAPDLAVEGEMHGDTALDEDIRKRIMPNSKFEGMANLLIMPNVESANISYNLVKILAYGVAIGPILLGAARPVHVLTPAATSRGILNMTAVSTVAAQVHDEEVQAASRPTKKGKVQNIKQ